MRCPQTVDAGVYVLGALAPAERAQYERHLADCPDCREEVAEFAVLPGLMGRLDAATAVSIDAPAAAAPPKLLDNVLRAAGAERGRSLRRRRWQFTAGGLAAACLAVLAAVGVSVMVDKPDPPARPVVAQMQPIDEDEPIVALLGYGPANGGTDIRMLCLYETSTQYHSTWMVQLVVYPRNGGQPMRLKPWPVTPGQDAAPSSAQIGLAPSDIGRIELDRADGEPLLVYQAA